MKKITVFILALLYLTTSLGVMINMHYCMGKLVESNFSQNKNQNCSYCGMKETGNKGCCENKQKFLKINKDQKIAVTTYKLPLFTSHVLNNPFFKLNTVSFPLFVEEYPFSNAFPRWQNLPLFISNCVFLI